MSNTDFSVITMVTEIENLHNEYFELLNQQKFNEQELDYSILEKHKAFLTYMSGVDNSGITIFDLYKKEHVFASLNFSDLFGYDIKELEKGGNEYFNSRVHPDDFITLMKNGIKVFKFFFTAFKEEQLQLKLINEYRILNKENRYIRVIEQHQPLELDKSGNMWLSLGIIDISPNQETNIGVRSQIINFKTGKFIELPTEKVTAEKQGIELSSREKQILHLIKEGYLSKEISDQLFISVHTVNTHRQRILEKLNANNSLEAVKYASSLGLLS
jgi:DNA-binding CsgD family transcriptional regulator/PAS domain-containing protein